MDQLLWRYSKSNKWLKEVEHGRQQAKCKHYTCNTSLTSISTHHANSRSAYHSMAHCLHLLPGTYTHLILTRECQNFQIYGSLIQLVQIKLMQCFPDVCTRIWTGTLGALFFDWSWKSNTKLSKCMLKRTCVSEIQIQTTCHFHKYTSHAITIQPHILDRISNSYFLQACFT